MSRESVGRRPPIRMRFTAVANMDTLTVSMGRLFVDLLFVTTTPVLSGQMWYIWIVFLGFFVSADVFMFLTLFVLVAFRPLWSRHNILKDPWLFVLTGGGRRLLEDRSRKTSCERDGTSFWIWERKVACASVLSFSIYTYLIYYPILLSLDHRLCFWSLFPLWPTVPHKMHQLDPEGLKHLVERLLYKCSFVIILIIPLSLLVFNKVKWNKFKHSLFIGKVLISSSLIFIFLHVFFS